MKRISVLLTLASVLGALGVVHVPSVRADDCGGKGQKSCPLQGWMEENVQVPMEQDKLDKVAASLEKVASLTPDKSWTEWESAAKAGAAAAKSGDVKAMKKSCKSCHKAYRKEYKAKYRMNAPPK